MIYTLDKERAAYMLGVRKEFDQRFKEETSAWEAKATRFAGAAAAKARASRRFRSSLAFARDVESWIVR